MCGSENLTLGYRYRICSRYEVNGRHGARHDGVIWLAPSAVDKRLGAGLCRIKRWLNQSIDPGCCSAGGGLVDYV
jgi:hypothetical protein